MLNIPVETTSRPAERASGLGVPAAEPRAGRAIGRVRVAIEGGAALREVRDPGEGAAALYDLIIPCAGAIRFCQGDRLGECPRGAYVLLRRDRFHELTSDVSLERLVVSIPVAEMRTRLAAIEDHCGMRFAQDPDMAGMLRRFVEMLMETFELRDPPNAEALATEIIAIAALTCGAERRDEAGGARNSRQLLKRRIFDFVEANLEDAELSPKRIAEANRISPSYLYSLFSDNNTTVSQFIQVRRLQRAYEILISDPNGSLTVSEIAYMVGFKNASHFSRSFSRYFRVAPRDARHSGLRPTPAETDAA